MKFKKIIVTGLSESELSQKHWIVINNLTDSKIFLSPENSEFYKHLFDTDCLLVKFNPVDKKMIDSAPDLKYIGIFATGFGKIDIEHAKKKNITVCNVPGYSTESVAEFVFAAVLEHIRELEKAKKQARKANYSESGFSAIEIKDKVFGIIGLGKIGTRVAEIAHGFGANVKYWSRSQKELKNKQIKYEDIDSLILSCDFLSLHLALTKDTDNFLNKERIAQIKKGAIVINTAPMELVDIEALEKRLQLDDMTFILDHSDEMTKEDLQKLSSYKNCIIYPPIAYISNEAGIAKREIFVSNIENYLKGSPTNNVV